jgi:putative membrane protein (TIGR04086 family)
MQTGQPQQNSSPPPIQPTGFFTGIKILPVLLGMVIDIVATIMLSTVYYIAFVAEELSEKGLPSEDAMAEYWSSSEGIMASLVIGTLGTAIGGFYAARKAGVLEIKHGALVGVGSILIGMIMQAASEDRIGINEWQMMIAYAAAIPAGALGGAVAEMFRDRAAMKPPTGGGQPGR